MSDELPPERRYYIHELSKLWEHSQETGTEWALLEGCITLLAGLVQNHPHRDAVGLYSVNEILETSGVTDAPGERPN